MSVHLDQVSNIRLHWHGLYFLAHKKLYAIKHLSFIQLAHLFQKFDLVVRNLLEDLDFLVTNDLLERIDVEVIRMGKIIAQLGTLLHRLGEIVGLEIIVKNKIIAHLRDLYRYDLT